MTRTTRKPRQRIDQGKPCETVEGLEAETLRDCRELVRTTLGLDCTPEVIWFAKLSFASEPVELLEALEQLIRKIQKCAEKGAWLYHGNDIIFSVRPRSTQRLEAIQIQLAHGAESVALGVEETVRAAVSSALVGPLRIVLDDERPPLGESGSTLRLPPPPCGLPRTDVLRKKLAAMYGASFTHKQIAALSVLLQPAFSAYVRAAFNGGAMRARDVIDKETNAIKAECHALGIKRSAKGRPRGRRSSARKRD